MTRPIEYEISALIDAGQLDEARAKLQESVEKGKSMAGAARIFGCNVSTVWRWAEILGVSSFYDGREGGLARWNSKKIP